MPISKRAIGTCEGGLTLVIRVNRDLVIARVTIKIAEEGVIGQSLEHLINEGEREMILPGGGVEFSVIDTHRPSSDSALRNQLIVLVLHNYHFSLLGYDLYWIDPFTILNGVNDTRL